MTAHCKIERFLSLYCDAAGPVDNDIGLFHLRRCGKKRGQMAVAAVASLQVAVVAIAASGTWLVAGLPVAQAVVMGGGCALGGTLAYVVCQQIISGRSASRLLWGHVAGEAAKAVVALGLLAWALSADTGRAGPYLAGFIVALLAFPVAILLPNK
jgi:hypothetical protein